MATYRNDLEAYEVLLSGKSSVAGLEGRRPKGKSGRIDLKMKVKNVEETGGAVKQERER